MPVVTYIVSIFPCQYILFYSIKKKQKPNKMLHGYTLVRVCLSLGNWLGPMVWDADRVT